jgi:SHS2 domain-containing protein
VAIRWVEGEDALELHIEAATQEQLYEEATVAFGELVAGAEHGSSDRLPVLVQATEPTSLIAEFLNDLIYLAVAEGFAAARLERLSLDGNRLRAAVSGRTGPVEPLVGRVESSGPRHDRAVGTWSCTVRFS